MIRDDRVQEAKRLLHAQLARHPQPGVRALNEVFTLALPDEDPRVQEIAAGLPEPRCLANAVRRRLAAIVARAKGSGAA